MNVNNSASSVPMTETKSKAFTLACVEDEITRQQLTLFNLYVQKNSFSLTHQLPVEILQTIFICCARDYHIGYSGHLIRTLPNWVNVSYVCHHWRNAAINCPSLWVYLFITSPRWTELLLSRSKDALLKPHVNLDSLAGTYQGTHFIGQLMNHVERIQELHLELPGKCLDILSEFSSCAPRLEHLKISVYDSRNASSLLRFPLPFRGDTPALRTLELSGFPMPWYSFNLSDLKTLRLHEVPVQFQQGMAEFLTTLGRLQGLTTLYLENALGSATSFLSGSPFYTFQKINLPHLSRIFVTLPISTIVALLSCINILPQTELTLECIPESYSSPDYYEQFSSLLAQRLRMLDDQTPSNPGIHSLVIETSQAIGYTVLTFSTLERYSKSPCEPEGECGVPLRVIFDLDFLYQTSSDKERIISSICRTIPSNNIQTLHVSGFEELRSHAFWKDILEHFQDIRYLKLSDSEMPDLASLLSVPPHDRTLKCPGGNPPLDQVLVPALEQLELYKTYIPTGLPIQEVYSALASRKESKGQLMMAQCTVSPSREMYSKKWGMVGKWEDGHFHLLETT